VSANKDKKLYVDERLCKGCGICVEFCPAKVLVLDNDKVKIEYYEKCTKCGLCELRCPDYAIYLGGIEDEE